MDIPPGTKVRLTNPEFCNGRILLRSSSISILGGAVSDLVELWKSQEALAMKTRYRRNIRDASLNPPKFISFSDFIRQRQQGQKNQQVKKNQQVQKNQQKNQKLLEKKEKIKKVQQIRQEKLN